MIATILKIATSIGGAFLKTGKVAESAVSNSVSAVGGRRVFVSILSMLFVVWAHYAHLDPTLIMIALAPGGAFNIGESIRDTVAAK